MLGSFMQQRRTVLAVDICCTGLGRGWPEKHFLGFPAGETLKAARRRIPTTKGCLEFFLTAACLNLYRIEF
jgi:hypothetical protein